MGNRMPQGSKIYIKKPIAVKAMQLAVPFEVDTPEGLISSPAGDYLVEDENGHLRPVAKDVFEESHEQFTIGGTYGRQRRREDRIMSELTPCNFCTLKRIKAEKPEGSRVMIIGNAGWLDIYVVAKGEKLDTRQDPKTGNHKSKQFRASFLALSETCCC